jgi:endonuclease YncB( thermonuclease family)
MGKVAVTALMIFVALVIETPAADLISGVPHIVDGDTVAIGDTKIRLEGIDAPETDQVCLDDHAAKWTCGIAARDRLAEHVAGRSIDCMPNGSDAYHRTLAVCSVQGEDLNAWMVSQGWALAFKRYSAAYVPQENTAREGKRGLWNGAFIAPWDWRHRDRQTVVLGSVAVPITAQAELLEPASAAAAPSPDCIIKGNVNRHGERIYFRPGQLDYAKVNMTKPGKRWFCSEEEAQAAGWRPALR